MDFPSEPWNAQSRTAEQHVCRCRPHCYMEPARTGPLSFSLNERQFLRNRRIENESVVGLSTQRRNIFLQAAHIERSWGRQNRNIVARRFHARNHRPEFPPLIIGEKFPSAVSEKLALLSRKEEFFHVIFPVIRPEGRCEMYGSTSNSSPKTKRALRVVGGSLQLSAFLLDILWRKLKRNPDRPKKDDDKGNDALKLCGLHV